MSLTEWLINSSKHRLLPCCLTVTSLIIPWYLFVWILPGSRGTTKVYFVTFRRANETLDYYVMSEFKHNKQRWNPGKVSCHSCMLRCAVQGVCVYVCVCVCVCDCVCVHACVRVSVVVRSRVAYT